MGVSQVVRQQVLILSTVGANPTRLAIRPSIDDFKSYGYTVQALNTQKAMGSLAYNLKERTQTNGN